MVGGVAVVAALAMGGLGLAIGTFLAYAGWVMVQVLGPVLRATGK